MLEASFQRRYALEEENDWAQSFDTNTDLFDSVKTLPSQDLADSLAKNDEAAFKGLSPQDIIHNHSKFRYLHVRWNKFCQVQETITIDRGLSLPLTNLAKASPRITLLFYY